MLAYPLVELIVIPANIVPLFLAIIMLPFEFYYVEDYLHMEDMANLLRMSVICELSF